MHMPRPRTYPANDRAMAMTMPRTCPCPANNYAMAMHMPRQCPCHGTAHALPMTMPWTRTCTGNAHAMALPMPWQCLLPCQILVLRDMVGFRKISHHNGLRNHSANDKVHPSALVGRTMTIGYKVQPDHVTITQRRLSILLASRDMLASVNRPISVRGGSKMWHAKSRQVACVT